MKIAIAQLNPTIGDLPGNAQQILVAAEQAIAQGARLMLTTELSLCGYPPRDLLLQPSFVQAIARTLAQLARDLPPQLAVLVGTVTPNGRSPLAGGKPLFNSSALLEGGKIQQYFHKRLLPTYDVFDEDRYFEPGLESTFFELKDESGGRERKDEGGRMRDESELQPTPPPTADSRLPTPPPTPGSLRIGVTICEDLWNDEEFWGKRTYEASPIEDLVRQQVDFVVNLSASPYTAGKQQVREAMLQHGAIRFKVPILYANQVGGNDDLLFDGNSFGVDASGEVIFRARPFESDLVLLEYTPEGIFQECSTPAQEPGPSPTPRYQPDSLDAEIWMALVLGVRDYVRKCGFKKIVLGLSGGIDSSLVAAIAAAAIGPENVLGILMPSPYSSDHSVQDALHLAKNLGIQTQILPIGDLMKTYDETFADLFAGTEFGIAEENIQSRIRGNLLMAVSNKFGHLLISTGNKSEMAVGYCTLYGDMNGGLAAIADVPKTRVYSICHWLNEKMKEEGGGMNHAGATLSPSTTNSPLSTSPAIPSSLIPHSSSLDTPPPPTLPSSFILHPSAFPLLPVNILTKPPSAELKPGQVDQDSLPPYEVLDDILERFIEKHQSPEEIQAAGHAPETISQVIRLVVRAEFKRKQAPPGLKITDRAFGTGWRMPIANHWRPAL